MNKFILFIIIVSLLLGQADMSFAEDGSMRISFCYLSCWIDDNNSVDYSGDGMALFSNGYLRWAGCIMPALGCSD